MATEPFPGQRKQDHLTLAAQEESQFRRKTSLLEQVQLLHCALPEHSYEDIDTSISVFGIPLRSPFMIAGMTGGIPQSQEINRALARAAEYCGIGFGLGSQRILLEHPEKLPTYQIREIAPTTLVLANLGLNQARDISTFTVRNLVEQVGANVLCLHVNPAMELIQAEGDRDFRGGVDTIRRLQDALPVPIVIKETGCGLSYEAAHKLRQAGVEHIDVGGAGGTSWVGIEARRSTVASRQHLGDVLWDWGIPTAASLALIKPFEFKTVIATGGIRNGLDAARALALGANVVGVAAPVLRAYQEHGYEGVVALLQEWIETLRAVVLLTGQRSVVELAHVPKILGPELQAWIEQGLPSKPI